MDDRIIQMLPKVHFPGAVFTGANSLFYLKTLDQAKTLIVASETAWRLHRAKIEKHMQSKRIIEAGHEPTVDDMESLKAEVRKGGYESVIGFGGGSAMDLAKTSRMQDDGIRLVLIPTTSGTGSESSRYAIMINEKKEKEPVTSEKMVPDVVLLDHSFTLSLPPFETAYTSIDALSHSVEGLVSRLGNPLSDSLAAASIDIIAENLPKAFRNQLDAQARSALQVAGFLGGLVQSSASVGLAHSFANCLGPKLGIPHGAAIAAFLPDVVRFNMEKSEKCAKLRNPAFLRDGDVAGKLSGLLGQVGLADYLNQLDFSPVDIDAAAESIKSDVCTKTNPYNPSVDEIRGLLASFGVR
ncbi:MAG: iron-containing alcohol dehydrogenase [Candidatus Aenigmarchaeota archaeon]|nr:iron-containing alcohol dehydrogenase [Candidatus Aenigmarchaeota archaeon]